jgi:hypothetical protein
MRLVTYVMIALGLMFLFNIAGVETGGSGLLLDAVFGASSGNLSAENISIDTNVSVSSTEASSSSTLRNLVTGKSLWYIFLLVLSVIAILSLIKVSALSFSFQPDALRVGTSVIAIAVYALVLLDMIAVWKYVGIITNATGWIFIIISFLMMIFVVGFLFSLIKFITQGD